MYSRVENTVQDSRQLARGWRPSGEGFSSGKLVDAFAHFRFGPLLVFCSHGSEFCIYSPFGRSSL
jgi:hypothetical protein